MTDFKIIGRSIPRFDGPVKASGETKYLADIDIPGCWLGRVVRSREARGLLKGVEKLPGFDETGAILVTAADIPGENFVAMVRTDYPALAAREINYRSQAAALIAAPDMESLDRAEALLKVDIEPLPPIFTIEDSLAKKEIIWGEDNVIDEYRTERGDIGRGFAEADIVVEGNWSTGLHEQMYLETQGMSARPMDGGIEVMGSMQCPFYVHNAVRHALGLPADKVVIKQTTTGGAFGGKEDYPSVLGCYVALLAMKSGHPVKIIYGRSEDLLVSPKRHPSESRYRMGLKRDGTITALDAEIFLDAGAYTTLSRVVLQRTHLHAAGAYYVPNVRVHSRAMATNTPPNGAFRGFGAPQAIFAMEREMDLAAAKLEIDPLDIRLKNALKKGDIFPYGQTYNENNNAAAVLEKAAEMSDYRRKRAEYAAQPTGSRTRMGIGIAVALHGGGFTGAGEDKMGTTAKMAFDGEKFRIYSSSTEMGQGAVTVLPMVAAEALGVGLDDVFYVVPDTSKTPNTGPTVASRTTMYAAKAVQNACENLKKVVTGGSGDRICGAALVKAAKEYLKTKGPLEALGENIFTDGCAWDEKKFEGSAYRGYAWIANAIEVEVDTDTYEATAKRAFVAAEVGRAINPMQAEGQLVGGVLQGIGWAHIEDMRVDEKGKYTAAHMNAYLVPTTLDSPEWQVTLLEDPCEAGCYGAKGIGELPANAGAPAFTAAVENAVGVSASSIPLTGEKLFTLMEEKKRRDAE